MIEKHEAECSACGEAIIHLDGGWVHRVSNLVACEAHEAPTGSVAKP